jgi:hypothetical protein
MGEKVAVTWLSLDHYAPGRPWTLWSRVAWTHERTGRSHVIELGILGPPCTRPLLDSLMSSMTWTNERTGRSHVIELEILGPPYTRPPLGSLHVEYIMDQWENRSSQVTREEYVMVFGLDCIGYANKINWQRQVMRAGPITPQNLIQIFITVIGLDN